SGCEDRAWLSPEPASRITPYFAQPLIPGGSVICSSPEPSALIRKSWKAAEPPTPEWNTICDPSGDQDGVSSWIESSVSCTKPVPSALITHSSKSVPPCRHMYRSFVPSGDQVGARSSSELKVSRVGVPEPSALRK